MRIAAISHSCVVDINQGVYAELARREEIELLLIAPKTWRSSLTGTVEFRRLAGLEAEVAALEVRWPGSFVFHSYIGLGERLAVFRPDVVYVDEEPHSITALVAARWAQRLNCGFVFATKQNMLRGLPWPLSGFERAVHARSQAAIVVSQAASNVLRARGYRKPVFVVPHGIDPELFRPRESEEVRGELYRGAPSVGYIGRLDEEKGVLDLMAAGRRLLQSGVACKLVLIGRGSLRARIEAEAVALPDGSCELVEAVGHDRAADYIGACDVLVLPSRTTRRWTEQFGRVIIEALACGVPVVGSDSGHIPYLIETTGGGLVFREGDADDLAGKLETLLKNAKMRREMGARGRQAVLNRYTNAHVAEALAAGLADVVEVGR